MALSPYKSTENSLNRSRSSSCSSPTGNCLLYQEIYSVGSSTLVRSYSCNQVFDKDVSGRAFRTTQIHVSSFITPEKKILLRSAKSQEKKPRKLALEYPVDNLEMSKKKKVKTVEKPSILKKVFKKTMILSLLTVTVAYGIYFYKHYKECSYVWDLEKTETELKQHIFGQDQALTKISSVLKTCNSSNDAHILVFTGGVGTGKTYSSTVISRNFPWSSNKLITYSEHFTSDVEKLLNQKLATYGCNLVVVDDLSIKTAREAINLIALLNNERKKNENLLVILIFQTLIEDDRSEIVKEFKNSYLNVYHAPFKPLTKDAVEKCFQTEIQRQEIKISKEDLEKLVEEKMKPIDIIKGPSGCKGVFEEVSIFYKKSTG